MTLKIQQNHVGGIGLIQIMLVIVVIAFFSVYAAVNVKIRAQNLAIGKTAIEIENWLQASMEFLLVHNRWPTSMAELYGSSLYITQSQVCSPWLTSNGTSYCKGKTEYKLDLSNSANGYFGITVETPNQDIANKLMAQLPNATVHRSVVSSYVPIPGAPSADPNSLLIKGVFKVTTGYGRSLSEGSGGVAIKMPLCPPNWTPDYEVALRKYYVVPAGGFYPTIINVVGARKNQNSAGYQANTASVLVDYSGQNSYSGDLTVFTFCIPPGYYNGNDATKLSQNGV